MQELYTSIKNQRKPSKLETYERAQQLRFIYHSPFTNFPTTIGFVNPFFWNSALYVFEETPLRGPKYYRFILGNELDRFIDKEFQVVPGYGKKCDRFFSNLLCDSGFSKNADIPMENFIRLQLNIH